MSTACSHFAAASAVMPRTSGCAEWLKSGDRQVHLRAGLTCGRVGCCGNPKNGHATVHYRATGHPLVRSRKPGVRCGGRGVDERPFDPMPAAH